MKNIPELGIQIPEIYLPRAGMDLHKWAVIACDQFTSEPEYWAQVGKIVGSAPSTLHLTFPEVYLGRAGKAERIRNIQSSMRAYLDDGTLQSRPGLIYVERSVGGRTRKGLMLALDLEHYDYSKGSKSLIRATEGTIEERLPPRIRVREGALLELPHILVLIDDPGRTVIEPIGEAKQRMETLYDLDLMLDSGHLRGYAVDDALEKNVIAALSQLAKPAVFAKKYSVDAREPVLLFAMGDGNHSLATAKAIWEKLRSRVGKDHPARFALVEIENVHDEGLEFEPIHRVLFNLKRDLLGALQAGFGASCAYQPVASSDEMIRRVNASRSTAQVIGLVGGGGENSFGVIELANPKSNLPVGGIQPILDLFIDSGAAERIDYVHGGEVVTRLGSQAGNAGIYLPTLSKSELFKIVILDGVLPRKTFSMGAAREKRFYMEARKISK